KSMEARASASARWFSTAPSVKHVTAVSKIAGTKVSRLEIIMGTHLAETPTGVNRKTAEMPEKEDGGGVVQDTSRSTAGQRQTKKYLLATTRLRLRAGPFSVPRFARFRVPGSVSAFCNAAGFWTAVLPLPNQQPDAEPGT